MIRNNKNRSEKLLKSTMQTINTFRLENFLTDVDLILNDAVLPAHKVVLYSGGSISLRKLLDEMPDEKSYKINGIPSFLMAEMLNYMYTEEFQTMNMDFAPYLYYGACLLGMKQARRTCVEYLRNNINPTNCFNLYNFSRTRDLGELLKLSKQYICHHILDIIRRNNNCLMRLNCDDMCLLLASNELNIANEETVWRLAVDWISFAETERKSLMHFLLKHIRIGLVGYDFFRTQIKTNKYVVKDVNCKHMIEEAIKFYTSVCKLFTQDLYIPYPEFVQPRKAQELIFVTGGWSGNHPTSAIEAYDPRADRWTSVEAVDPKGSRAYHGVACIGTKVYMIGGFDGTNSLNSCRSFDLITKTWSDIAPMYYKRCYVSVTVLKGLIYAIGGFDGEVRLKSVECYDPRTNQWSQCKPMQLVRSDADATECYGKIYVIGGFDGTNCTNTVEKYDPVTDRWTFVSPMVCQRSGVSCVAHKDAIYVFGGYSGTDRLSACEKFDLDTGFWTMIASMQTARSNMSIAVIDDTIYAIGGYCNGATIERVEAYDICTNQWKEVFSMSIYRSALACCVIKDLENIEDYRYRHYDLLIQENAERLRSMVSRMNSRWVQESGDSGGPGYYIELRNLMRVNDLNVRRYVGVDPLALTTSEHGILVFPPANMDLQTVPEQEDDPVVPGEEEMVVSDDAFNNIF